ncbi:unnamed protein product [marine sediment metagenome]|uniref:Uncharacterized protein n=1 Tax=marine sediment metagenome TaxID=412755 RepID=X1R8X1_9ZZZZ
MAKRTKVPTKGELFLLDRMDLLALIKKLRDETKELRTTIRAKNITIREERMTKRQHWAKLKRYREVCGRLTDVETQKNDNRVEN